jgi:NAD(P)H-dependent FMN reductase
MHGAIHLLMLSDDIEAHTSSSAMLRAYAALVPSTISVSHYTGLESLPPFNPSLDGRDPPPEVADLRDQVASADALVISTPDSPSGLTGSMKNALDWLVSSAAVMGKRVAVLSADCGTALAEQALERALHSMSASIVPAAAAHLNLPSASLDERAIIAQAHLRKAIFRSIDAISDAVTSGSN